MCGNASLCVGLYGVDRVRPMCRSWYTIFDRSPKPIKNNGRKNLKSA